jgi:hypothetical protein
VNVNEFAEAVKNASDLMNVEGAIGWGLDAPYGERTLWTIVDLGNGKGCDSRTCQHMSHDPYNTEHKLVLKEGNLIELGTRSFEADDGYVTYYAVEHGGAYRFYKLSKPAYFWAGMSLIDINQVPDYMLDKLAAKVVKEPTRVYVVFELGTYNTPIYVAVFSTQKEAREFIQEKGFKHYDWRAARICNTEFGCPMWMAKNEFEDIYLEG